jgi:DNA invertase Pin-like site-specific DNA recombinase
MLRTKSIVGYARVSTVRQGVDSKSISGFGLGLESQIANLEGFAKSNGVRLLKTYVEIESGRRSDREQLRAALGHARRAKATLVVSKLDRLARSCLFLSQLLQSDVPFLALDMPAANETMIQIMAALGEHEAKAISERTKVALQQYKARGGLLGASLPQCRNLTPDAVLRGRAKSAEVRSAAARTAREELAPIVTELRAEGLTLDQVATRLNEQGLQTRRGRPLTGANVCLLLQGLSKEGACAS